MKKSKQHEEAISHLEPWQAAEARAILRNYELASPEAKKAVEDFIKCRPNALDQVQDRKNNET